MMHEFNKEFKDLSLKDHIITIMIITLSNSLFMIIISYGLDFYDCSFKFINNYSYVLGTNRIRKFKLGLNAINIEF